MQSRPYPPQLRLLHHLHLPHDSLPRFGGGAIYVHRARAPTWQQAQYQLINNGHGRKSRIPLSSSVTHRCAYSVAVTRDIRACAGQNIPIPQLPHHASYGYEYEQSSECSRPLHPFNPRRLRPCRLLTYRRPLVALLQARPYKASHLRHNPQPKCNPSLPCSFPPA